MEAIVKVTDSGGTYTARAKVERGKALTASCTMGREFAAKRAAGKALGCDEDRVKLTPLKGPGCAYKAEWHPDTFNEPLTWRTSGVPDADTTVLAQAHDKDVGEAFWDGEAWRWASSTLIRGGVRAWADMPAGLP